MAGMTLLSFLPPRQTPAARFRLWLERNRHVYDLFKRFAAEVRASGRKKYSARDIVHRIRWHYEVETNPPAGDEFKLNDHLSPYLARLLIEEDPTFEGFFELRKIIEPYKEPTNGDT